MNGTGALPFISLLVGCAFQMGHFFKNSRDSLDFKDKVFLITGASSGIGAALAKELDYRGAKLVLCARRLERLQTLALELKHAVAVGCDVRKKEDLKRANLLALERFGKIDGVIANAGFGVAADFEDLTLEDYRNQFETNLFGVLGTAYACLEELKKTKGSFVLIGSVAGYIALPGISAYAMSKFAVRALAESLTHELAPAGISVVLISPGFIESEFRQVNNQGVFLPESNDPMPSWLPMKTNIAARKIVNALLKKQPHQILTVHGKIVVFFVRHFPFWVSILIRWRQIRGRRAP
jgi:short-subunit dehydrogenase